MCIIDEHWGAPANCIWGRGKLQEVENPKMNAMQSLVRKKREKRMSKRHHLDCYSTTTTTGCICRVCVRYVVASGGGGLACNAEWCRNCSTREPIIQPINNCTHSVLLPPYLYTHTHTKKEDRERERRKALECLHVPTLSSLNNAESQGIIRQIRGERETKKKTRLSYNKMKAEAKE